MSTLIDCEKLVELGACEEAERVLYLGPRDPRHLSAARSVWPKLITLDKDPLLKPGILCDLETDSVPEFELCIASYVLMYVKNPVAVLRELLRACTTVLLQENVARLRGNADPCRNRFVCPHAPTMVRVEAVAAAAKEGKLLVELIEPGISGWSYYPNGPGISAMWRLHERRRP